MKEVPVIYVDFGDEKKAVAFSLADNKSHEWSEWDFPKLKDIFVEIDDGSFDMALTGFKEAELQEIFGHNGTPADAEPQLDRAEELNKKWQVKTGDLFTVGSHRLLCGDSIKAEDVARVMGDVTATFVLTDSGSTLIACEQLGRKCRAIEIEPQYVQVAIDRWEAFTGQKAVKAGGAVV